jgi:Methyltransferase domain
MRRKRLRTPRAFRRARRVVVASAIVAVVLLLLGHISVGASLLGGMLLCLVLLESSQLRHLIIESQRQQYALTQIRPLLGDLPVDLSGWAADPVLVHNAIRLVIDTRPSFVVECGSGSSTIAIAGALRACGGRLVSLEHDAKYADRTREMLRLHGLEDVAVVVTAPLTSREIAGQTFQWYTPAYEPLLSQPIQMLLVDGPPGSLGPKSRYPAVPILKPHLAEQCSILMDDGDRADEREVAHTWCEDLQATLTYLEGGRGGWLLQRTGVISRSNS